MNNIKNNILIISLTCASLLMAILYSPIGNPNDYSGEKYYAENQGVAFSGLIENAPKSQSFGNDIKSDDIFSNNMTDNNTTDDNITTILPITVNNKQSPHYSVAKIPSATVRNNTKYTAQVSDNSISNTTSGNPGGNAFGDEATLIIGNTSKNNIIPQNNGLIALNVDLTIFDNLTPKQAVTTDLGEPVADPGNDQPLGSTIPVPDGFWFMLLLAVGYAGFKMKNFIK